MRILITGGAGYIGTKLIAKLAALREVKEVVAYDNLSRGNYNLFLGTPMPESHKIKFIKGDLLDSRLLKKCLETIDIVFHLAARVTTPFANTDPHLFEQTNHWGTAELVYAIEQSKVKKLVYLSSTSVYGSTDELVNEKSPLTPRTFYGISKKRAEEHVLRLVESGRAVIIRSGNVYGYSRSMRFDAVVNKFVFETNFFGRLTIQGSGRQSRAFIHVDKLVNDLSLLLTEQVPPGVYNLVARNLSVLDIAGTLKDLRPKLEFLFVDQHLQLRNIRVDTRLRLADYLPLAESRPLAEDLDRFLARFSFGNVKRAGLPGGAGKIPV